MKLAALAKGLKTKIATHTRNTYNKQYLTNKKTFFTKIRTPDRKSNEISDPPTKEDILTFWSNLWANKGAHNPETTWL